MGHALFHDPLHLWNANAFYPHPLSLAFSDSLLGYGPVAWIGTGTVAALVRYNLLFLFAWSLCFFGAYLLARELGLRRIAAAAAGLAFAYAPYRVTEAGHLHVISSGGIALALFLLLRGYRRDSRALVLGGWVVSAWQVSLGFTLGLQYCYLLAVLALIVVVMWARRRRRERARSARRGEPAPDSSADPPAAARRSRWAASRCSRWWPPTSHAPTCRSATNTRPPNARSRKSRTTPRASRRCSPPPRRTGSGAARPRACAHEVHSKNEDVFFPGGLILALAIVGLFCSTYTPRLRLGLGLGVAVCSILALGMGLNHAGYPYRLLYDFAPGWNGVRVPGRVFTTATLFYALLAGAGAQLLLDVFGRWWRRRPAGRAGALAGSARRGGGAAADRHPRRRGRAHGPPGGPPAGRGRDPASRARCMDLPTNGVLDRLWQYYSTDGFPKIPIGNSTFDIPAVDDLRGGMLGFPDKASVEKLRYYGIKTVVLHTVIPKGLPPERGSEIPEPPDPVAAAAQADRRPGHHPPAGRLGRDLRDRPRAQGPAWNRLSTRGRPPPAARTAARRRRSSNPSAGGRPGPAPGGADGAWDWRRSSAWGSPSRRSSRASPGTRPPTTT